jgi:hypothetical protein
MTDLVSTLLPQLRSNRLPGLELGDGYIYPHYTGRSILNIPASVCQILGAPAIAGQPLSPEILRPLGAGVEHQPAIRHVILVLMDALALHRLQRWIADGTTPIWGQLAQQGLLAPLTSITPSTTSAALTSLWSGRSAAEHGITGYEMWMKEYGVVANTILHAPINFKGDVGSLERAGFDPAKALPFLTLGPHLGKHGIEVHALQHVSIVHSGLSKMLLNEVQVQAFNTATDLWVNMRHLLEKKAAQRLYTWIYWSEVDHFGHFYGPDDERTVEEFAGFSQAMEKLFLNRLSPAARRDTLLILTADHGQITTRQSAHYELSHHPELESRLHIYPTGENRLTYLYIRPGQTEAVREYLQRAWPNQVIPLEAAYAIEKGLFGPGNPHPSLRDRLGDLILVWQNDAYLWWANKENPLLGRHGGLHAEEMLVPFLAVRL